MAFFANSPLSPPNPTVKRLLKMIKRVDQTAGRRDERWEEKAVKSLAKKLKKSNVLDELEKAIANEDPRSACIKIPRSADGRLQVSQRKGLPHVIYCRMWRWPDLQSQHHLKSLPCCRYPYSRKLDDVCINPFHYERIEPLELPPIFIPKSSTLLPGSVNEDDLSLMASTSRRRPELETVGNVVHLERDGEMDRLSILPDDDDAPLSPFVAPATPPADLSGHVKQEDEGMDQSPSEEASQSSPFSSLTASPLQSPIADGVNVEYCAQQYWCSISYYELNHRVGDTFYAAQPSIIVDGGCNPSDNERFCLGQLSNVNRDGDVMQARKHIGQGARFYMLGGEIFAECLSESAIFVQSPNCNHRAGWHPGTVAKIPPNSYWKIFDCHDFANLLKSSVSQGFESVYALTRMCTIRVSFVKGWGADYRRQTITATPCWVELHLNGPLTWLDRVLSQMGSPVNRYFYSSWYNP